MPTHQVITFHATAPISAAKMTRVGDHAWIDDACADGLSDMQSEEQEGDEVEECRPEHGGVRRHHSRRYDCGDRVGGIVQAVQKVKYQSDGDEAEQDAKASSIHGPLHPV